MSEEAKRALAAFTYGERLKSLVLVAQVLLDNLSGMAEDETAGAKKMLYAYLKAAANEASIAVSVTREDGFNRIAEELLYARGSLALGERANAEDGLNRGLVAATTVSQKAAEILAARGML